MWIVRLALRRPYTFVVMAILILVMGIVSILRTPTDIFPKIDIPVVSIIWNYNGLVPEQMADRIVSVTERNLTTVSLRSLLPRQLSCEGEGEVRQR
jgi:multidrug efflux pump subunit AcrB